MKNNKNFISLLLFSFFNILVFLIAIFTQEKQELRKHAFSPTDNQILNNPINQSLRFWGYYHVNCSDIYSLSYLTNANIIKINRQNYRWQECLEETKKYNLKAIVDVKSIFFIQVKDGAYGDGSLALRSDWLERWENFKSQISNYQDFIYAFYFDEPYWKGIKEEDFLTVTNKIRQDLPNIGIFIIEAVPSFADYKCRLPGPKVSPSYYKNVTDMAFDFYGLDYLCGQKENAFYDWNKDLYLSFFNKFLFLTTSEQKIWLVPQTFWPNGYLPNFSRLSSQLNDYFQIAQENSRVIGLLNFLFSSTDQHISAKQFFTSESPYYNLSYKNQHLEIGYTITQRNPLPTPTPSTQEVVLEFTLGKEERKIETYYNTSWYHGGRQLITIPSGISGSLKYLEVEVHHLGDNKIYAKLEKTDGSQRVEKIVSVYGDKTQWLRFDFSGYKINQNTQYYLYLHRERYEYPLKNNLAYWLTYPGQNTSTTTIKNYRLVINTSGVLPSTTPTPSPTPIPTATPTPTPTPTFAIKPSPTPTPLLATCPSSCPQPIFNKVQVGSSCNITISWNPVTNAQNYQVIRSGWQKWTVTTTSLNLYGYPCTPTSWQVIPQKSGCQKVDCQIYYY